MLTMVYDKYLSVRRHYVEDVASHIELAGGTLELDIDGHGHEVAIRVTIENLMSGFNLRRAIQHIPISLSSLEYPAPALALLRVPDQHVVVQAAEDAF